MLADATVVKNQLTIKDTEMSVLKGSVENLTNENKRLKIELENLNLSQVNALKDRQSSLNSTKLLETKFEAAEMEKKYLSTKVAQLEN